MEKSFDLGSVLRKHQKKHKSKPTQFESVAGGVLRRIENCKKQRKSSRLTSFDCTRNLAQPSPEPVSEAKLKAENRRQQLQKWKIEKEQKKKELAAKKVKPFVTGVPHNPIKYVPPPPARAVPSSSGRVTRSQTAKNLKDEAKKLCQSFAPINAGFRAPQIKTLTKIPVLEVSKPKKDTLKSSSQIVLPASTAVTTRSRRNQRIAVESKVTEVDVNKPKAKISKPVSKPRTRKSVVVQSSSSSENECVQRSSSSTGDLTARIVSSSEESDILSSTENNSSKSLQSSSSSELEQEKISITNRKSIHTPVVEKTKSVKRASLLKEQKVTTPQNRIPRSESSSEEKLRSPKSPVLPMTPEQIAEEFKNISPCVTMSRGKDNARKEMKKKLEEGLLDEDAGNMESVEHFQRQLASEIKRITEICETWEKINEQMSLSEYAQGELLGAVGQARLLMTQKMQQFAQLVARCGRPEPGAALVTAADLRGFWDMLYIQVENVDMRFKKLEELQARDWAEAAGQSQSPGGVIPTTGRRSRAALVRGGVLQSVVSRALPRPARSPATPRSLLQTVLSSEAEKASASKKSASFAMLRASLLGKTVEYEGIAPLPATPLAQIDFTATPGRSILKQSNAKSSNKQIKVVLFNQSDEINTSVEDLNLTKDKMDINLESLNLEEKDAKSSDEENLHLEDKDTDIEENPMPIDEEVPPQDTERSSRRKSRLSRQDAFSIVSMDAEPSIMTRRMRKNMDTPQTKKDKEKKTPKRSARKKVEVENIEQEESEMAPTPSLKTKTPRRSIRQKDFTEESMEEDKTEKKTPKRSARKKALIEIESNIQKELTPARTTRRKSAAVDGP